MLILAVLKLAEEGMFLTLEGHITKTQKRPNTEPQGVPEALDRFIR